MISSWLWQIIQTIIQSKFWADNFSFFDDRKKNGFDDFDVSDLGDNGDDDDDVDGDDDDNDDEFVNYSW